MTQALSEHIDYLSLPGRNALYRQAIAATIAPGDTVADLGCGVGVLGLMCLESGASQCWGIDESAAIHLARESMDRAGFADRYTCIADSTFRTQLPEQVDLIIYDHVGFMGFDYGIIPLLRDARARFLKPGGAMIPQALDLWLAPVSSDVCRDKVTRWHDALVPPEFHWFEGLDRNTRFPHNFSADDVLGAPNALGHIDLATDEREFFRFEATLLIDRAGRFDGFAGWFDCQLAGDVRMNNSPLDPASIQRPQAFFPARESFAVEAGDEVRVSFRFRADDNTIAWTIHPPGGAAPHKLSTFNSMVLTPAGLVKDPARPLALSAAGAARAYVLSQVDGQRSGEEIIAAVLAERPDLLPSEQAIRDFVQGVLARDCSAAKPAA
ncbi:MAG: methyltransferase [Porphyrobacter sp.]|nr:methyltransferase [Porphyrobacter sp.]